MAAAADMAARLKGHMTQHFAPQNFRALKDLHAIFADAATAHAADAQDQADCRVDAPLAVDAAGPKEADCLPPVQRPPLSPAPPPRVARPDEAAPAPQQVPPRPAAEWSHRPDCMLWKYTAASSTHIAIQNFPHSWPIGTFYELAISVLFCPQLIVIFINLLPHPFQVLQLNF